MPEFEHIPDMRTRLLARLNFALRNGAIGDDVLLEEIADGGNWSLWTDFERDTIAKHLLAAIEDELGAPLA